MAPAKGMRRPDLIVPYQAPNVAGEKADFSATLSSSLPMAALFLRNKYIGWGAVVFAVQSWLGESEEARKNASAPGYASVLMAVMALLATYMPLFLPPKNLPAASGMEAPAPQPLQ